MTSSLPIDILEDELRIRRLSADDAADLLELYSFPSVSEFEIWGSWNSDFVEATLASQADIQPGDPGVALTLAVELIPERKLIGDVQITIHSIDNAQGEIGFSFHPGYRKRGFATKAVYAVLGYGFHVLDLHRIIANVDVRNERSCRLLERLGMRREAHFKHVLQHDDKWIDDYVYAILDDEWNERA